MQTNKYKKHSGGKNALPFFKSISRGYYFISFFIMLFVALLLNIFLFEGFETSILFLVTDGRAEQGRLIRYSTSDTDAVNPYNELKNIKDALTNSNAIFFTNAGKLNAEPGEIYKNTLVVTHRSKSMINSPSIIQDGVNRYNNEHSSAVLAVDDSRLDDSIMFIKQLMMRKKRDITNQPLPANQILETLEALEYYVTQPVSQFVQIPNTFVTDDDEVTLLIASFNTLQNGKQSLLNTSNDIRKELLEKNKQLLLVQKKLITLINERKRDQKDPVNYVRYADLIHVSNDDLLSVHERLIRKKKLQATHAKLSQALVQVGAPVVKIVHKSYPMIALLSLFAGLLAPLVFSRVVNGWKQLTSQQ